MKRTLVRLMLVPLLLLAGGCWDMHEIQNISYVTALGVDYEKGEFTAYAQLIDFASIAKQEGGRKPGPTLVWVGKGKGKTLNLAMNDLYKTAQGRIMWSQLTLIVLGENVLKQGISTFKDAISRYREIRFTPWMFGTKMPIEELFVVPAFFELTPLSTLSHKPKETYSQFSRVVPVRYVTMLSDLREPSKTMILPSLDIMPDQWEKNGKPETKMYIDGVFAIHREKLLGWLDNDRLSGLRWMTSQTSRTPLLIEEEGELLAVLSMEDPRIHVNDYKENGRYFYKIKLSIEANLVEQVASSDEEKLKEIAEKLIREEIERTFRSGIAMKADLYQLEYYTYKSHYKDWKRMGAKGFPLRKDSITDVEVSVRIRHAGMIRAT
ncbi:Ger(x)C family spore germination protein [Paenibacillus sp. GYB004]|uniref:Ger(x)C family spore germination protein n=1 Tax=Paenibacillus sp. GYB004 TaxID=2994393 RepID=UPI002F9682F4